MPAPTPALRCALLAAITLAALALRLSGIGWMLPHVMESDNIVYSTQVDRLERNVPRPEEHPKFGYYPLLVSRLTVLAFDPAPTEPPPRDLEEALDRASALLLHIRIVVAVLSVLIVPATYFLARRFVPDGAALVAALLMATSLLHLWFSQQARPHAAAAAFTTLGVVAALRLRSRGRAVDYLLAGAAVALALGTLQSGGMAVLAAIAAILLRERTEGRASRAWSIAALAIAAIGVRYFYPYLFVESRGKDAAQFGVEGSVLNLSGHSVFLGMFSGGGWRHVGAALWGFEPWLTVLAAAGLVLAAAGWIPSGRPRAKDLAVVLAAVVPYVLAIGMYERTYQRFLVPLLPYLCILAAWAIWRAAARLRPAAAVAVIAALVAPEVAGALRLNAVRRAPDTAEQAAAWLEAERRPGEDRILLMPTFELPLAVGEEGLADPRRPWFQYLASLPPERRPGPAWDLVEMPMSPDSLREQAARDPVDYLRGLRADYVIVEAYERERAPPVLGAICEGLPQIGDRVARFSPDAEGSPEILPIAYQDDGFPRKVPWFLRVIRARRSGPVLEVWRIRSGR